MRKFRTFMEPFFETSKSKNIKIYQCVSRAHSSSGTLDNFQLYLIRQYYSHETLIATGCLQPSEVAHS